MFNLNTIQGVMKIPVTFCDKCKFPITSSVHEYNCSELIKEKPLNNRMAGTIGYESAPKKMAGTLGDNQTNNKDAAK